MTAADPAVPPEVGLLRAFTNTVDHEDGTDVLREPADLTRWLREQQLLGRDAAAGEEELALALALRDGLRAAMTAHHDVEPTGPIPQLATACSALPLRLAFAGSEPYLEPAQEGARGALAKLLVAVEECRLHGTWSRLKVCPSQDCQWAFYDTSKSRTRVWCSMGACGNRTKTRAYRARRRARSEGG